MTKYSKGGFVRGYDGGGRIGLDTSKPVETRIGNPIGHGTPFLLVKRKFDLEKMDPTKVMNNTLAYVLEAKSFYQFTNGNWRKRQTR